MERIGPVRRIVGRFISHRRTSISHANSIDAPIRSVRRDAGPVDARSGRLCFGTVIGSGAVRRERAQALQNHAQYAVSGPQPPSNPPRCDTSIDAGKLPATVLPPIIVAH